MKKAGDDFSPFLKKGFSVLVGVLSFPYSVKLAIQNTTIQFWSNV